MKIDLTRVRAHKKFKLTGLKSRIPKLNPGFKFLGKDS